MRVMSADWTTCRVVRDRDGELWFRGCDSDDLWTANTNCPDVFLTTDEVLTVFGPLMPVLDADGLPVVHTVGDLIRSDQLNDVGMALWTHAVCPDPIVDALMAPARTGEVSCPACFLIHPEGACDR